MYGSDVCQTEGLHIFYDTSLIHPLSVPVYPVPVAGRLSHLTLGDGCGVNPGQGASLLQG